jgi:hypothetical protein
MVWEGLGVVKTGRVMLGETNPKDSAPGTIRGDYCVQVIFVEVFKYLLKFSGAGIYKPNAEPFEKITLAFACFSSVNQRN